MNKTGFGFHGISLAAMALALGAGHAMAGDTLAYGPAGDWVKPIVIPKSDPTQETLPFQFLADDTQVHFGADGDTTHNEYVLRVQSTQGLQAAQSFVTWNPDVDDVTINKAQIIRGDQVIDLLKTQTYTVARRETNLDRSMLDGVLTGILQPEGLQVGDVVDYAFTIHHRDPVFGGNSEAVTLAASTTRIGHARLRVTWDKDKPIRFRQSDDLPAAKVTPGGGEYVLEADNLTAGTAPDQAPDRYAQLGYVEFSQFASWKDISRLMAPHYDKASTLAGDSPLKAETAKIRAASTDPKIQAAMAVKLVENSVRYLFLGMNQGGYIPADADVTWQRRFGDCKGKTALLLALLHDLGIKAEPALVSTQVGDGLDSHLPEMEFFDHVIVRAEIAGKVYWLDATRLGDRDLDSLRVPPWHFALPVSAEGADLEPLAATPYDKPETETILKLDATAGLNVPARAHFEVIYRYDTALETNQNVLSMNAADLDKSLKAYWTNTYSWVTPTKVSATYDEAKGEEHFVMDGTANMEWDQDDKGGGWKYTTDDASIGWSAPLKRDPGPHREAPMQLMFPNYYITREEIDLPKGDKGFTIDGASFDKTVASTQFHRAVALKGNVFTLESSKRSLAPEITYADALKANDELVKMWSDMVHVVAPLAYKTGAAEPAAVSDSAPVTADDFVARAGKHLTASEMDLALSDFNQALRLDPANSKALQGRALVFMTRGKYDAALADCQQAVKTDPTSFTAYNCIGQAYAAKQQYKEAIDALTQALAIYPNDVWALQARAGTYMVSGDKDKARADAETALDLDPTAAWAVSILAGIQIEDGKRADAMATVDKALAVQPDNINLIRAKISFIENCFGMTGDECLAQKVAAVPLYDQIIAKQPDAYDYAMRAQDRAAGDRDAAMADIDTALKLDAKSTIPLLVRAAIYMRDKDWDKALADTSAAVALDPKDEQALNIRASVLIKLKRVDEAFADYDTVLALHPDNAEYLNNACWSRALDNVQLDKALELCNAALKAKPDSAHILDSRGLVELRLGQYDAAITDYDAALAKDPKMAGSLYGRGLAKLKTGKPTEGKADLDAARALSKGIDDQFKAYGVAP